jgi:hypothetical protein
MKKITFILIILVLVVVLFSAGCTSGQSGGKENSPVFQLQNKALIYLHSVDCSQGKYNWVYCSGYIINEDNSDHWVSAFVDIKDSKGTVIDSYNIYEKVDAKGRTAFNKTFSNIQGNNDVKFSCYINTVS